MTSFVRGFATVACLMIGMCAANAQAARTWVSGVGDDRNQCTLAAPCQTFAGAMAKTAAGGEIDVLDPGDFGAVTITKALTIDGGGGQVASADGITVQAGPNDVVTLRNLRLNGLGHGINGIRFQSGAGMNIENCYVSMFLNSGIEIEIASPGQANINIRDTVVHSNFGAIRIQASGAGTILAALERVQMNDNAWFGLRAEGSGSAGGTGQVSVSVVDSQASSSNNGIMAAGHLSAACVIINRSAIVNNATNGLVAEANGTIVIGNSTIGGNGTGVNATAPGGAICTGWNATAPGGAIYTNGKNSLIRNFISDGAFSPDPMQIFLSK
jgi:hypothetical protein